MNILVFVLVTFAVFPIMNDTSVNTLARDFGAHMHAFPLDIFLGMELLGCRVCVCRLEYFYLRFTFG